MKLDLTEIVDRAVREAFQRRRQEIAAAINRLADESGVVINGVRHVSTAGLLAILTDIAEEEAS